MLFVDVVELLLLLGMGKELFKELNLNATIRSNFNNKVIDNFCNHKHLKSRTSCEKKKESRELRIDCN